MISDIVSIKVEAKYFDYGGGFGRYISGETLEMKDGSRWFHPYTGGAPLRLVSKVGAQAD